METRQNRKIRFAVIGTNFVTDWVIAGAREDDRFELAAVYSRTQERASLFAARHGIPRTFTSLEALAGSRDIDAVYVASPNFLHASQSIRMMNGGKHVLCEKPMASNVRETEAMIEAARRNGVVLMEAMKPTLTPNFRAVMEHIPEIGPVRRYFSAYCQYSSRYDQLKEGVVMNAFRPEMANGALVDIGVYTIYPMIVLFGRPDTIRATGMKLFTGVDGQGGVTFGYPEMDAAVIYSKIADSGLPTEIQGEKGSLRLDRIHTIGDVRLVRRGGEPENLSVVSGRHEYYYEVKEFIDLIVSGRSESEVNSHRNSLLTAEVMQEIRRQLGIVYPADCTHPADPVI